MSLKPTCPLLTYQVDQIPFEICGQHSCLAIQNLDKQNKRWVCSAVGESLGAWDKAGGGAQLAHRPQGTPLDCCHRPGAQPSHHPGKRWQPCDSASLSTASTKIWVRDDQCSSDGRSSCCQSIMIEKRGSRSHALALIHFYT